MNRKPFIRRTRGNLCFLVMTVIFVVLGGEVFYGQGQPSNTTKKESTPAHEIWAKYAQLKFDISPEGKKAAKVSALKLIDDAVRKSQDQYDQLVQRKYSASTIKEFQDLAAEFRAMKGYQDTADLAKECDTEAGVLQDVQKRKDQYDKLVDEKKYRTPDKAEEQWQKLAEKFRAMIPYEDSEKLADECEAKYDKLKEERLQREYAPLVRTKDMLDKTKDRASTELKEQYLDLAAKFRAMDGYQDTADLAKVCEEESHRITADIERRRQEAYNKVVQAYNEASTKDQYQKLAEAFQKMNGYQDSADFLRKCEEQIRVIEQRELQEQYNQLVQAFNKASTEQQFQKLADDFQALKLHGHQDSANYVTLCKEKIKGFEPVDLNEAIKASGGFPDNAFSVPVIEFAKYGSPGLKNSLDDARGKLNRANATEKAAAQAELDRIERQIKVAQDKIAQTNFIGEYTFSISSGLGNEIKDLGSGKFGVEVVIWMHITDRMVNKVNPSFPSELNVKVEGGKSESGAIYLSITGNADDIQKLVRGADNYRVKVWFNRLRTTGTSFNMPSADVTRIDFIDR